jgi:hypothetical protein
METIKMKKGREPVGDAKQYVNARPWIYRGEVIDEKEIESYHSFVYKITHIDTGFYYIGKKQIKTKRTYRRNGKAVSIHKATYKGYFGSGTSWLEFVDMNDRWDFQREIIHLCHCPKIANYLEINEQMKLNCIYDGKCFNENIAGRYFFNINLCKYLRKQR